MKHILICILVLSFSAVTWGHEGHHDGDANNAEEFHEAFEELARLGLTIETNTQASRGQNFYFLLPGGKKYFLDSTFWTSMDEGLRVFAEDLHHDCSHCVAHAIGETDVHEHTVQKFRQMLFTKVKQTLTSMFKSGTYVSIGGTVLEMTKKWGYSVGLSMGLIYFAIETVEHLPIWYVPGMPMLGIPICNIIQAACFKLGDDINILVQGTVLNGMSYQSFWKKMGGSLSQIFLEIRLKRALASVFSKKPFFIQDGKLFKKHTLSQKDVSVVDQLLMDSYYWPLKMLTAETPKPTSAPLRFAPLTSNGNLAFKNDFVPLPIATAEALFDQVFDIDKERVIKNIGIKEIESYFLFYTKLAKRYVGTQDSGAKIHWQSLKTITSYVGLVHSYSMLLKLIAFDPAPGFDYEQEAYLKSYLTTLTEQLNTLLSLITSEEATAEELKAFRLNMQNEQNRLAYFRYSKNIPPPQVSRGELIKKACRAFGSTTL